MFTAEEARVMTQHGIDALSDRYYNQYRSKAQKAIQEAIDFGRYETTFNIMLGGHPRVDKLEEAYNRLIDALTNDYHYKVTVEECKIHGVGRTYYKMYVTVSWENGGN